MLCGTRFSGSLIVIGSAIIYGSRVFIFSEVSSSMLIIFPSSSVSNSNSVSCRSNNIRVYVSVSFHLTL